MSTTGYSSGGQATAPAGDGATTPSANLERLRADFTSYLSLKTAEIDEQKEARRYYHGSQWSWKAIEEFRKRKQPIVTYNREAKKINAIVGLLERQRQDPRAYPRTPMDEDAADIATASIRYVLDEQRWKEKSPVVALTGGVDAIGGMELVIEQGDVGDPEIGLEVVDPSTFFYDPRSLKADFSDARFMGVSKWADIDSVISLAPAKKDEIRAAADQGSDMTSNPDSEIKWISGDAYNRKVRLIDHWYMVGDEWMWCLYTGDVELASGPSYLADEKNKSTCKYIMYSANVDQDGDRYGFHRGMKSPQDEVNQRRSKGLHILNTRRIIVSKGQVDDVEKFRREMAKPDGVGEINPGFDKPITEDAAKAQEMQGQLDFLQDAKNEIDNFGFNPSLVGTGVSDLSGRAIQLQQQAGIAELGPYLLGYKGWKLRLYRAVWSAIRKHWTAQRWIRVTDDPRSIEMVAINQPMRDQYGMPRIDPRTGQPAMRNSLAALDVDIIIDEGPDEINTQADAYDTLTLLAQKGVEVPPELLIELSPLPGAIKQKAIGIIEQAQQQKMQAAAPMMQLEVQGRQAQNVKTMAEARRAMAQAANEGQGNNGTTPLEASLEWRKALLSALTQLEVARISAKSDTDSAMLDAKIEALLGLSGLANDQMMQLRDHAQQQAMVQLQPPAVAAE